MDAGKPSGYLGGAPWAPVRPVIIAAGVLLGGCFGVPWYDDPATPVDVLWIHGLSSSDAGYDGSMLGRGMAAFDAWGWDGEQHFVAYHGCDSAPDAVWADHHGGHGLRSGGPDAHAGPCGGHDSSTPIEHIAHHVAWLIKDRHASQQRCVALVAHSMGGLVVQALMTDLARGHPEMPGDVCIRSVVTLGAPLGGADIAVVCEAIYNHTQCQQMTPGSDLVLSLDRPHPEGLGGTRHVNIISEADGFVAVRHGMRDDADVAVSYALREAITHGEVHGYFEFPQDETAAATWRAGGDWTVSAEVPSPLRAAFEAVTGGSLAWAGDPNRAPAVERTDPSAGPVAGDVLEVEVECTADPDRHAVYVDFMVDDRVVDTDRDLPGFSPSHVFDLEDAGSVSAVCRDDHGGADTVTWSVHR